jgi:outer membrane biosynthesis protein TonB
LPKNEDGEFELILGNKQLLSMFFVVVVLLGVFFVMGYIVGRNSAPLVASVTSQKPEGKPLTVESPAPKPAAPETPAATAEPAPSNPTPAAAAPQPEKTAEAAPAAPAKSAAVEQPKSEPKRETKAAEKAEQAKTAKARAAAPIPAVGATYLQLSATDKADADKMVDVLRKNNFVALDAEVPEKPGLYRVLVGPIPTGELNKTKTDLQAKGFPGNAAIKKTF